MCFKCASYDPDTGKYDYSVSGDQCMYLIPKSVTCVRNYGEGPEAKDSCQEPADKNEIAEDETISGVGINRIDL